MKYLFLVKNMTSRNFETSSIKCKILHQNLCINETEEQKLVM